MSKPYTSDLPQSPFEIIREDSRGKFITLSDHTNFPQHYQYMFHTPVKERSGDSKVRAPYNKVAINLIVYADKDPVNNTSFSQYMDVDEFTLFSDKVNRLNRLEPGAKMEIQSFIGFSEKSKTARSLKVIAQPAKTDPTKVSFMLSFQKGEATPNSSGVGFSWGKDCRSGWIVTDQDTLRRFCLVGRDHFLASRTAAITRCYESLYTKK